MGCGSHWFIHEDPVYDIDSESLIERSMDLHFHV
jgi:hypothetical protein